MAATDTSPGTTKRLATYADRAIVAQRIDGIVQLRDEPARGDGRAYLIEPEITQLAELEAIVADYQATALRIDRIPMQGCWF